MLIGSVRSLVLRWLSMRLCGTMNKDVSLSTRIGKTERLCDDCLTLLDHGKRMNKLMHQIYNAT